MMHLCKRCGATSNKRPQVFDDNDVCRNCGARDVRPHEKCALTGVFVDGKAERVTWCGRTIDASEWAFVDAGHATLNAKQKGFTTLCERCRDAMVTALTEHGGGER